MGSEPERLISLAWGPKPAIPLPTLFEKSGAEGTYRRFKFELQAIARRDDPRCHGSSGAGLLVLHAVRGLASAANVYSCSSH